MNMMEIKHAQIYEKVIKKTSPKAASFLAQQKKVQLNTTPFVAHNLN